MVIATQTTHDISVAKHVLLSSLHKRVGKNIRIIRKRQNLTLEKLGSLADVDPTYLSLIENGKRNPTLFTLGEIAHALNVDPGDLLK